MNALAKFFTPDTTISKSDKILLGLGWAAFLFLVWEFVKFPFLPTPTNILASISLLTQDGTFDELYKSIWTMAQATFWMMLLSLTLAYLSAVPFFKPVAVFAGTLRYIGVIGLILPFTIIAPDTMTLRVMILTFGMSVFYISDVVGKVQDIPQEEYDHAKTLGLGPFRMVYEVAVLGTLAAVLDSLIVNAPMGWAMLTFVEGVTKSSGGIGSVMIDTDKHKDIAALFGILVIIFCVGKGQDYLIRFIKLWVCPYAGIGKGRS